ncbi:MAG: Uncharacterized protein AWU57_1022 [Marinobacter sp. T13-3]|nr:MAG: Uncharacterized protein AWU57_1022 [Marinobacter sp. T13-3]
MTLPAPKRSVVRIPPEQMHGSFIQIALPNMEQVRPIYGRMAMLACMKSLESMAEKHLGPVTVVWLHKTAAFQIHDAHPTMEAATQAIERFYDDLCQGIDLNIDGAKVELHWINRPLMAVVEQGTIKITGERFNRAREMLEAMEMGVGNPTTESKRRILMSSAFQTPKERLRDQANDWRRQQALQDALINQGIHLTFREVRATLTDTLIGYTASPAPLTVPGCSSHEPPIDARQMWALARRSGARTELAMTLLRTALNQLRIWQVLVPANDIALTIEVEVDCLIENQDAISCLLKEYSDVSDRLVVAMTLDDNCRAFKEQELTGATIADLHEFTGTRFALSDMGFGEGRKRIAQTFGAHAAYLAPQWGASQGFYEKAKPIIRSLVRVLHTMRSEVIATNMSMANTNPYELADLGIDAYELRPDSRHGELTEDDAILQIERHQQSIASTVINARFRFGQPI